MPAVATHPLRAAINTSDRTVMIVPDELLHAWFTPTITDPASALGALPLS